MLIDSHCHLDESKYEEEGIDAVIKRAEAKGVERFLTVGTNKSEFSKVISIAETYPQVYCSVGTHPHHAEDAAERVTKEDLIRISSHEKVVAIGECGLDYFYENSPKQIQKECFEEQIEVCLETGLPVIIHTRDAEEDTINILKNCGKGNLRGVVHCFSGTMNLAKVALDLGLYISFSGIITFKKSEEIQEVAKITPMDRILVETDCPYLAPVPHRGKVNEPAFVTHNAMKLSELKRCSIDEIYEATTNNFYTLFNKAKR